MPAQADPDQVQRLRALAGNPLTALAAAAICQADLFTAAYLRATIGWDQDRIARAIASLIALALVEAVERYTYRLTPRGQLLAGPLSVILTPGFRESLPPTHQPALLPTPGIPEANSQQPTPPPQKPAQFADPPGDSRNPGVAARMVVVVNQSNELNTTTTQAQAIEALRALRIPHDRATAVAAASPFTPATIVEQAAAWAAYRDSGAPGLRRDLVPSLAAKRIEAGDLCPYEPAAAAPQYGEIEAAIAAAAAAPDPIFDDDALALPEPERLWRHVLDVQRQELQPQTFTTFLADTSAIAGPDPDHITVICGDVLRATWVQQKLAAAIRRELAAAAGRAIAVTFTYPQQQ